jgi:cytochrome b6-f complex iron-sulfur subunit
MSKKDKKPESNEAVDPSRREFLKKIWFGLGALFVVEIIWIVAEFLRPRKTRLAPDETTQTAVAGRVEEFDPNSVTAFPKDKFYLVRLEDGGFLALHRECTHLDCTVPWIKQEQRFVCPCHASAYDITGRVLNPPAPRPLDIYPVRIENGIVKVDTKKRIKRDTFEPGQVTYE